KIWSSMTEKERDIIRAISENKVKTADVCERSSINNSTFSRYREGLIKKGIIESPEYGYVSLSLPRFYEIVRNY
ncbi:MAG: ATP-binding protein, partial [Lachnospiraceae bacterium]|nr:ATP-binding protein [Lachnospiraceae bacterium]